MRAGTAVGFHQTSRKPITTQPLCQPRFVVPKERAGVQPGGGGVCGRYAGDVTADRRTKIVCTIGPASRDPKTARALVEAGMDAARLNFSHGSHSEHAAEARLVRELQELAQRPLALVADLQGPKLRVGEMHEGRELQPGDVVTLVSEPPAGDGELVVSPPVLTQILRPGHDVLIDDGRIRLAVSSVAPGRATCDVVVGGRVDSHKGVNVPGVPLPVPCITKKDVVDLEFALELGVDYIALSFVRSPEDLRQLRERLQAAGSDARIIAKIEKGEALDVLDPIVEASDAVMVARGDLGVEIGPAAVPLAQKRIVKCALRHGKPVITANADARVDAHAPRAHPGRGIRHRQRDTRRQLGHDALR